MLVVTTSRLIIRGLLVQALDQLGLVMAQTADSKEALYGLHRKNLPNPTIMELVMPNLGGLDAILKVYASGTLRPVHHSVL